MNISTLINKLEELKKEHGNLEVGYCDGDSYRNAYDDVYSVELKLNSFADLNLTNIKEPYKFIGLD